jgi:hypothetical protein
MAASLWMNTQVQVPIDARVHIDLIRAMNRYVLYVY